MTNTMLSPEMLAHTTARDLRVGDLAVFTDYAGREIGCSVTRMFAAGEISSCAHIEVRVAGLSAPAPYTIGMKFTLEATKVRGAV